MSLWLTKQVERLMTMGKKEHADIFIAPTPVAPTAVQQSDENSESPVVVVRQASNNNITPTTFTITQTTSAPTTTTASPTTVSLTNNSLKHISPNYNHINLNNNHSLGNTSAISTSTIFNGKNV